MVETLEPVQYWRETDSKELTFYPLRYLGRYSHFILFGSFSRLNRVRDRVLFVIHNHLIRRTPSYDVLTETVSKFLSEKFLTLYRYVRSYLIYKSRGVLSIQL